MTSFLEGLGLVDEDFLDELRAAHDNASHWADTVGNHVAELLPTSRQRAETVGEERTGVASKKDTVGARR